MTSPAHDQDPEAEPLEMDDSPTLSEESEDPGAPGSRATWVIVAGVVLALWGLGAMTGRTQEVDPATVEAEPLPVSAIIAVHETGYDVARSFVGRVEASRSSRLGFELGGLLTVVTVEEGDLVSKGELLAKLDTERLEARRRSLEAQLEQAEAEAILAELTSTRVREAQDLDAVSPQALDEAELGLRATEAARQLARSALDEIDVELAKSRLLSPFEAIIAERGVDEGEVVAAGTPILQVLERGRPEARIGVAGAVIERLAVGQKHRIVVSDREIEATVLSVLPVRRTGTRTVEVLLGLESELVHARAQESAVREGDLARLLIRERLESPGFWLPTSALTESSRGLWAVYAIVDGDDGPEVERRELELLHEEAERVFARGTLEDGERIVSRGLHRLVPGQRVRIHGGASQDQTIQTTQDQVGAAP